jgi:hypothetical protein
MVIFDLQEIGCAILPHLPCRRRECCLATSRYNSHSFGREAPLRIDTPSRSPLLAVALGLAILACGGGRHASPAQPPSPPPTQTAPSVPAAPPGPPASFADLYGELSEALGEFEGHVAANPDQTRGDTIFAAELLVANGNRGEALLEPGTMVGVRLYLDRLEEIGVRGVTLQIADPLLDPDYPRSDGYLAFFRSVADEVHSRGLILAVETGPVFPDPQFSRVQYDWSQHTLDEYFRMRRDQLVRIAREIGPDYLALGHEPATEAMLTGISFTLEDYLRFVREAAVALDDVEGTLIGAGTGTWEDPSYLDAFLSEPSLDFISLHMYPLSNGHTDYWLRAVQVAQEAKASGRGVVIGETWLYKATPDEVARGITYQEAIGRDPYSFWQPLDVRYLQAIAAMADWLDLDYVSLFWSGYFFGYLDYDAALAAIPAPELYRQLNQEQFTGIQSGYLTGTGRAYQALLEGR